MKKPIAVLAALSLGLAPVLVGCATQDQDPGATPEQTATSAPAASVNDADKSFAAMMSVHHEQAIEMSDIVLAKQGIDTQVANLAEQIKEAQGPEIEKLQSWQQEWGVEESHNMHDMGHGDGMMSEEDLQALQEAEGVDASKLFLEQMIAHHEGAVTMAEDQIRDGSYQPAIEMAEQVVNDQQAEIQQMKDMLAGL